MQLYAKFPGPFLQDFKKPQAPDADKTMPPRGDHPTFKMDIDVIPVGKIIGN